MPASNPAASNDDSPRTLGESGRGFLSLLITLHLFILFVVFSANMVPSRLQVRLVQIFRPYAQTLNFDPNFTPFYLTHATINDVDHRVEILPSGADAEQGDAWILLSGTGLGGGEPRRRYLRLARLMNLFAEDDATIGLLAKTIAEHRLRQQDQEPQRIRTRRHMLQPINVFREGTPEQRDANDASYFNNVYSAHTLVSGRNVDIVKIDEESQVARPDEAESSP